MDPRPGQVDLGKIRRNWEDIFRVPASIYTGTVRAYDVVTMLQRDGQPTALGEAIPLTAGSLGLSSLSHEACTHPRLRVFHLVKQGGHSGLRGNFGLDLFALGHLEELFRGRAHGHITGLEPLP